MKIVVCIKQVPEVTQVQVDPVTGTLIREGVQSILNPFCEYALDHAVRLRQLYDDVEIIAITMGPPQAKDALLRCLELGTDEGILVTDRKFAGADTWATAYTLAEAIRRAVPDYDLILTGKQAIDGDTAQVGPEIAEILGLPQITYAVDVKPGRTKRHVRVTQEVERGYDVIEVITPALVTCSKGEVVRRAPSLRDIVQARQKPIKTVQAEDLPIPEDELGLKGSYTQVVKVFPPTQKKCCQKIDNMEPEQAAAEIFQFLKERRYID